MQNSPAALLSSFLLWFSQLPALSCPPTAAGGALQGPHTAVAPPLSSLALWCQMASRHETQIPSVDWTILCGHCTVGWM